MPEAFVKLRDSPPVHQVMLRRFPYRVLYILHTRYLVVFALIHAVRHEKHWQRRYWRTCNEDPHDDL